MPYTTIQNNMSAGEISPDMMARVDEEIYYRGLSKAQNVVLMPHGGVRRRPGLTKIDDSLLSSDGRLFTFEFSALQDYLIVMIPNKIRVYRNGVFKIEIDSPYSTLDQIKDVDGIQSGDVMVFTHEELIPQMLRREGSDTSWTLIDLPLDNIPTYDFGQGVEPVWSNTRGWPGVCTFYQSRLWMAGSTQKPNSIWGSKINDYFDFDIGTGQADYAIFDTIDTDQYNKIINIFAGRNLMVFTSASEFYNTAEFITPETSVYKRSTSYGSKRLRPVMIDGTVVFSDVLGRTVRESVYEFQEDAYVAPSVSILSDHLITDVISMDVVKGTNIDVSDFLYVVNNDGTIAVRNSNRLNQISGWTQWTTLGDFIDVVVVNKIVYFLVSRNGEFHLEYMNEGTHLDHNIVVAGEPPTTNNVSIGLNNVSFGLDNVVFQIPGSGQTITEIDTDGTPVQNSQHHKVVLDYSVQEDQVPGDDGIITFNRPAYHAEVGYNVTMAVSTMPLNTAIPNKGPSLNEIKRVTEVQLNLRDTLGVSANTKESPDRKFTVVLDKATVPFTGLKRVYQLGFAREYIVEITQENPLPFKMLGLGYTQKT